MASTTATCSPSSLQLRLAFNCRRSPEILFRMRMGKPISRFRVLFVAQDESRNGSASGRRRDWALWVGPDSTVDGFSGWSESDGNDESVESQRKKWFGGVAGVILFSGLTFAALSFSKRNNLRSSQLMEPLNTQQEVSLASDDQNDDVKDGNASGNIKPEDSSLDGGTGTYKDSSSSPGFDENPSKSKSSDDSDCGVSSVQDIVYASNVTDGNKNASIQEDLQDESTFDDTLNLPESENVGDTFVTSGFKDVDNNSPVGTVELSSELTENPVNVKQTNLLVSDANLSELNTDLQDEIYGSSEHQNPNLSLDSSFTTIAHTVNEPVALNGSTSSQLYATLETQDSPENDIETVAQSSTKENPGLVETAQVSAEKNSSSLEGHNFSESESSGTSLSALAYTFANEKDSNHPNEMNRSRSESTYPGNSFSSTGIPAPSVVSAALQVLPGKVLVPAVVDQAQSHALAALQVLKVIEADVQPSDLCTRRDYARWLVSASSALSRNTISKVYPAMYIENVSELAFDDITPDDPDFASIQGLAEAGLIASKLSRRDMLSSLDEDQSLFYFSPERPLSRQDLISWKMALEKRQLPEADRKKLYQISGFIDVDKIHPDACPALVADISAGEQGIMALAFGYTRLFQPDKPVTKAQAAVALATGEASDIVSEELARIEAESMAENAVAAHSALVAEVEKDINASFEKELSLEREKIDAVEKMAEEARQELERLRTEREEGNIALMMERAAVESEMEILSRLRHDVEEQLRSLMTSKAEISYEKERTSQLRKAAEIENQEIARLQYELEVERKALSMARAWAEDEAKRAREQAKVLEEARYRWERQGIKVVVDDDLREETTAGVSWLDAGKQFSVDGTVNRAENLVDKLKTMAMDLRGKSRDIIDKIIQKIALLISNLREWTTKAGKRAEEIQQTAISRASISAQELQQSTAEFNLFLREGAKRVAGDCRDGVEKLTQRFKT
ncbi:hypothetical protein F2P56_001175 [Juglans regia]|uniref:Uncharacterized protein LOC108998567 isoform X1 n=2 Tax=Juglans regia TaxID=51240 RepID=A0A2I4FGB2_JUGRE|nr:uncharacterized protein LOC108998567 isoform X1 [Juglans regia]KAF5480424.1 hypothetical protein F2P56_001175 [Juglans regia]